MKKYPLIVMAAFISNFNTHAIAVESTPLSKAFFEKADNRSINSLAKETGDTRSSSSTSFVNAFEINADTDSSSANLKITPITGRYNFSFLLSTPLDKDTKEGKFYDTNAFTKSSYAEISAQYVFFNKSNSVSDTKLDNAEKLRRFCELHPEYFDYKEKSNCRDLQTIDSMIEKYQSKKLAANPIIDYWADYLKKPIWILSSNLKAGREDFDYLSGMDKQSAKRKPWGGGVNLTYLKPEAYMISAGYEYQKGYNPQKNGVVCPVVSSGSFVNCVQGAKGAPTENINHIFAVEYKQPFLIKDIPFAIAPKVQRDLEDDVTAVSIPVYFFQNEKGGLTGGLSTDWNSKEKDWMFGVFIGSAFDLGL